MLRVSLLREHRLCHLLELGEKIKVNNNKTFNLKKKKGAVDTLGF